MAHIPGNLTIRKPPTSVPFLCFCSACAPGQPTSGVSAHLLQLGAPVFLPGESQGWGSLVGCRLWGFTESDTTEVT